MLARATLLWLIVLATGGAACGGYACGSTPPPSEAPTPAEARAETEARPELALPPRPAGRPASWSPLGTNLDFPKDWSEVAPFVNLFHLSRAWTSAPRTDAPDDEQPIDVDAHGWVRSLRDEQVVRTGILWDVEHVRPGTYLVQYRGEGELVPWGAAASHPHRHETLPDGRHQLSFAWDPHRDGTGFALELRATDPDDPIRDIVVLPPGGACHDDATRWCDEDADCPSRCDRFIDHHASQVFHPDFLATLGSYGVIRFMNWQLTNDSTVSRWSERPRMHDARWSEAGVPFEVMIELSNRVGAHPWLHIPHQADDEFARELGALVKSELDPDLVVRVELSNEIWNGIFEQWHYAGREGVARGYADDPGLGSIHWTARRSAEVFRAFDAGFGAGARRGSEPGRVRHVLGTHHANPWVSEQLLSNPGVAEVTDELAIAPYFGALLGPDERDTIVEEGVPGLLRRATTELITLTLPKLVEQRRVAEAHGLDLVAYEAGQHLVAVNGLEHDDEVAALVQAANRASGMGELYERYLEAWRGGGGTLMVHFVNAGGWGRYGAWGALEHPRSPLDESPKWIRLETFARTTARWW